MMSETWETTVKIKLIMQQLRANIEQIREKKKKKKRKRREKQNKTERRFEINESFQLSSEDILSFVFLQFHLAFE